ncbi:cell division protein ZapA [bacterium]|nr:cell division protein ZapA [bacterium]
MPAVEVMILGKKHVFETSGNPDRVRAAAVLLERKVKTVSEHLGMISNDRTLVLAGLNIAEELIRLKQETRLDRMEDFLRGLSDRLELTLQSIREPTPAASK